LKKKKGISTHKNVQPSTARLTATELNDKANLANLDWVAKNIVKRPAFIVAKNVLEFGGGDFSRIFALALAFPDKVFYSMDFEYSKNAINNVIKYADLRNVNIIKTDARNNIFRDNFFDFAFSVAVGEHIAELDLFLKETYRVLKPGGEYYFGQAPFWTSVKGHHFLHWRPEVLDVLGGYEHLILSAEEMRGYLKSCQNLPFDIENCVSRIYFREDLSRLSERETKLIIERSKFIVDTWSTQYDELYDEQKAQAVVKKCSKYILDDLKIKGVVAVLRKPLGAERKLEAFRKPFSYRLGQALIRPIRSPGRIAILLLYRLLKMSPDGLKRVILKITSKSKILTFLKSFAETATLSSAQQKQLRPVSLKGKTTGYKNNIRVAVYADANMNLIDGSSVWTASLVEALAGLEYAEVFFFLKSKEKRGLLTEPLKKFRNVEIITPPKNLIKDSLTPGTALDNIEDMDRRLNFAAIVLRGFSLCEKASLRTSLHGRLWTYLTDIPQKNEDLTESTLQTLGRIASASKYILCQTEELRSYWQRHVPSAQGKIRLLPPMIPASNSRSEAPTVVRRICYAGKFAPLWGIFEMFKAFDSLRAVDPEVELHIYGDKIHNPTELPDFQNTVLSYLEKTAGVVWHRGLGREDVLSHMATMDLGWAWRSPELEDNTLELSTKILEYGRCGLPVILYRNSINEKLLGSDYTLFANTYEELVALLHQLVSSPDALAIASAKTHSASERFTVGKVRDKYVRPLFGDLLAPGVLSRPSRRVSILVAGHDLKFIDRLCRKFLEHGYDVAIDNWQGHNRHNVGKSRELIKEADIIISEWCLGNAVWYSKNKQPEQKHIIRFHLQERSLEYPEKVNMQNVDAMIFVGPHIRREAIARFGWERWADKKLTVIPNYVDTKALDLPKVAGAQFSIGIAGIVPQRKRLDLAADIIEKLRQEDERFHLYVKGKMPQEYPWMWGLREELHYYESVMDRIRTSDLLKDAVHFDGWGDDMPQWYQKIGFILSVSDFESFHLSVAEGAASRGIPLMLKWEGAEEIYPEGWSYYTVDEIVNTILDIVKSGHFAEIAAARYAYVKQNFDIERIAQAWLEIIDQDQK